MITQSLENRFDVDAILLFGSSVRHQLRPDSDIDIAIMTTNPITACELFLEANVLADKLHREIDLIDFHTSSVVFRAQFLQQYELLLDRDSLKRQYTFMRTLKEYAMLNEERKAIITKEINFFAKKGN